MIQLNLQSGGSVIPADTKQTGSKPTASDADAIASKPPETALPVLTAAKAEEEKPTVTNAAPAGGEEEKKPNFLTRLIRKPFEALKKITSTLTAVDNVPENLSEHKGAVMKTALKEDLDPAILFGLIDTLSGGDEKAGIGTARQGLMQIGASTAREFGVTNITNPEQNIAAGAQRFSEHLDFYKDQREEAYNNLELEEDLNTEDRDLILALVAYDDGREVSNPFITARDLPGHADNPDDSSDSQQFVLNVLGSAWEMRNKDTAKINMDHVPEWLKDGEIIPLVNKYADKYNLEPAILLGLIDQESRGDAEAGSDVGALGLTQLMPDTVMVDLLKEGMVYQEDDGRLLVPYDQELEIDGTHFPLVGDDRYRDIRTIPEVSVALGAKYMDWLMNIDGIDGRTDVALAAYNGGIGSVWANNDQVPPFEETEEYVISILAKALTYTRP